MGRNKQMKYHLKIDNEELFKLRALIFDAICEITPKPNSFTVMEKEEFLADEPRMSPLPKNKQILRSSSFFTERFMIAIEHTFNGFEVTILFVKSGKLMFALPNHMVDMDYRADTLDEYLTELIYFIASTKPNLLANPLKSLVTRLKKKIRDEEIGCIQDLVHSISADYFDERERSLIQRFGDLLIDHLSSKKK